MGCVCTKEKNNSNQSQNQNNTQIIQKQNQQKIKGKGVQIGGDDTIHQQTNDDGKKLNQNELIAQAAEKRMAQQQNRGVSQNSRVELQIKQQKLELLEKYEKERNGQDYNLRWN